MIRPNIFIELAIIFGIRLKVIIVMKSTEAMGRLDRIQVIGDRVLIKPRKESERTDSGLYLPPGVKEKEKIQYGYIVRSGPGYPVPMATEDQEPWELDQPKVNYVPLQVKEGDLAVFLQHSAYEVQYKGEKYFIVPQSAILMIERDDELF
jgi:co-chaperonin GroES (HSP10)